MRLHFTSAYEGIGDAYGYSVHERETRRALLAAGVKSDPQARVAFHVASPLSFRPIPGKTNVLYVAWESDSLPAEYAERMQAADLILVTAPFLQDIFTQALPDKPIHAVPLGVDAAAYPYRQRQRDRRRPFRYLWVGAPNARKGFDLALAAWRFFTHCPEVELYCKTTVTGRREKAGNVIFDSRKLSRAELRDLYHSAHCFVFPSFGEGFGLTLFEAVASGLPAVWTDWSAPRDYLHGGKFGYPLPYAMIDTELGRMARADLGALARALARVREDYATGKAQLKARRAARHVRANFTWEKTAARIIEILTAGSLKFRVQSSKLEFQSRR